MKNPPKSLSKESREIWRRILKNWDLDESGLVILKIALSAHDEYLKAKKVLDTFGPVVNIGKDKLPKRNPAAEIVRTSRAQFLEAWKMLHLDLDENDRRPGRPPDQGWKGYEDE